ncbi:MAG TPA: response regulator [Xanthobacteraceae bacterium]|nr:response regulator [Xanthobacteraceae bacterium]
MSTNEHSNERSDEILIVDDDETVRDSLSTLFELQGYRVTTFMDGESFVSAARTRPIACVLLDIYVPGKSGLEILKDLDANSYAAPILIMSAHGNIPVAVEAIKSGAFDFIEKRQDAGTIVDRVRGAIDAWTRMRELNGHASDPLSRPFPGRDRLTPRERDVLNQIASAASNKEAAKNLGISQRTVEIHRVHIMQKLGAKNTADLIRIVLTK